MGKILFLALLGLCTTSCIDNGYDLKKIETDTVTIGDDSSIFEAPLVKVFVSTDDINSSDGTRIDLIFKEADIWLPTRLPDQDGNGCYADVQRLLHDEAYVNDTILPALLEQMASDPAKLNKVATLLEEKYYGEFAGLLPGIPQEGFSEFFADRYTRDTSLRERLDAEIRSLATACLTELDVNMDNLSYSVERIDISNFTVDMLVDNLDPRETSDPKNTLHLAGRVDNRLPVTLRIAPHLRPAETVFTAVIAANNPANELPETRLFAEDLRTIVHGLAIDMPIVVEKYYPGKGFAPTAEQVIIDLQLIKRGALRIEL